VKRIDDKLGHVGNRKWRKGNFADFHPDIAKLVQRSAERIRRANFVTSISSDQQQVPDFWLGEQVLN
jgi:hypothetical protein